MPRTWPPTSATTWSASARCLADTGTNVPADPAAPASAPQATARASGRYRGMEPPPHASRPWATTAVRGHLRRWTTYYTTRILWSAEPVEPTDPPSQARVLDSLELLATQDLIAGGVRPHTLAAALTQLDAVERLRREAGFVADAPDDLPKIATAVARRVYAEVRDAIDAEPVMPWAVNLAGQLAARGLAAPDRLAHHRPVIQARTFQRHLAQQLNARAGDLMPRLAAVLREAEFDAVTDLRRRAARSVEVRDELDLLGAISRTRRTIGWSRAQLYALTGDQGTSR